MTTISIGVEGMTCGGCVKSIQNALNEYDGITSATADLEGATVTIDYDANSINEAALKTAIEDAGFDIAD